MGRKNENNKGERPLNISFISLNGLIHETQAERISVAFNSKGQFMYLVFFMNDLCLNNEAQCGYERKILNSPAHLKSRPFTSELLIVHHGFQDFLVSSWHQANSTHDLQNGHFGLDVLGGQALSDNVDAF